MRVSRRSVVAAIVVGVVTLMVLAGIVLSVLPAARGGGLGLGGRIALIEVDGIIADDEAVLEQIRRFRDDPSVRGFVISINSPGGVVTSGMAIYDTMQFIRPAVTTLCVGQAASMGSLLLAAGEKDMRFALPNARIMVHQPSGGFQGQATDIMLHAQEILNLKKRLNEIYVKHTGQSLKKIEDALERDTFLTADMARDFASYNRVYAEFFPDPASAPCRTTLGITALPTPIAIELKCIAVVKAGG